MLHRRPVRLCLTLSLLAASFAVPASATPRAPFDLARIAVGTVAGPVQRTYAVPPGAVLAGVTWAAGDATVSVRDAAGAWVDLDNDPRELGGRPGTEPYWLARGTRAVTFRIDGQARDARVDLVGAGEPARAPAVATREFRWLGNVVTRAGWGADESLRSGRPEYAKPKAVLVHHTVTRNDYTAAEAPGLIRAVYRYHTQSRGWDDVGYNVLVDRFGTMYEGRYGGFERGVVGSHTAGFNTGTFGVSLLGNYEEVDTPQPAVDMVARTGAWAYEHWGVNPRDRATLVSNGSPRYAAGRHVTVSTLSGHRDLGITACPGKFAYGRLDALRLAAWRLIHPPAKFSTPEITGAPVRAPHPVTVTARLSRIASWRAEITSDDGKEVYAVTEGRRTSVSVSWNGRLPIGLPALPGMRFRYRLTATDPERGPSVPVVGTFDGGVPAGL